MKKIFILVTISILFFSSCIPNPTENADPINPYEGVLKVDFDGQTFIATTTQAIVNDNYISLTGVKTNGEVFQITIPEVAEGIYTWSDFSPTSSGFALAYTQVSNGITYVGARDDSGEFSGFDNYTDTAEVVISSIDAVNKKISGTFKFTGVRFDDTGNAVTTKVFTNGSFTNIPFTADVPAPTGNSFTAKLEGVAFVPTNISGFSNSGRISIIGRKGSIQNISLNLISSVVPGTYDLTDFGDYVGQYVKDATPEGSSFAAESGTVTIISHNTTTKRIKGTFEYFATSVLLPSENYDITEGTFEVTYQ